MNATSARVREPHRLIVTGRLQLERAFHIGTGQANLLTDAAIRRDRRGQPHIPGSSLAGLLRDAAEEFAPYLCDAPSDTIRRLFGSIRPRHAQEGTKPEDFRASYLLVDDAYIREDVSTAGVEVRDFVGIDRQRAAARSGLQYDCEVAPSGTSYEFELSVQKPSADDIRLLLAILDFWRVQGMHLGGRTTTGLGQAKIDSLKFYALDFRQRDMLRSFLLDGGADGHFVPTSAAKLRADVEPTARTPRRSVNGPWAAPDAFLSQYLFVDVDMVLEEPLLIKGNVPEVPDLSAVSANQSSPRTSDAEFITALRRKAGALPSGFKPEFYIPGSSLKGVLRTRAEKIIRTLNFYRRYANADAAEADAQAEAKYQSHIAACAVTHSKDVSLRLQACFGRPELQRQGAELSAQEAFDESCLVCRVFGNTIMRGRLTCTEGVLRESPTPTPKLFDHVAIDRFTGGAADAKKFDTRPLMPVTVGSGKAPAFHFQLRLERPEVWMLGLLGHLLKDLRDADIRLGHATRRGYGLVRGLVTGASLLAFPDSELYKACRAAKLNTETIFEQYGPYYKIDLSDWVQLFGATGWGVDGPDAGLRTTPGATLIEKADRFFQALVKENEGRQTFGERHGTTDDSNN